MRPNHSDWFDRICKVITALVFAALLAPLLVVVIMSFNATNSVSWPPAGFSLQWYEQVVTSNRIREVTRNSIQLAVVTAVTSTLLGTIAGYALVRYTFWGRRFIAGLVVLPVLVPALLLAFGMIIVLTSLLGLRLSLLTLWVGHVTITLPFVTLIVTSRAVTLDRRLEDASRDLGAGWWRTMFRVVLPPLMPAVRAALLFSMVISLNEVIYALFLAGIDQTIPGYMYGEFLRVITPEVNAISTLMVLLAVLVLAVENVATRTLLVRRRRA